MSPPPPPPPDVTATAAGCTCHHWWMYSPPHDLESHAHNHEALEDASGPSEEVSMHSGNEAHHAGTQYCLTYTPLYLYCAS